MIEQINHQMSFVTAEEAATVFIDPLTTEESLKDDDGELRLFDSALMECKLLCRQAYCVFHDIDYDVDMEVKVTIQAQEKELTEVDITTSDYVKASSGPEKLYATASSPL